MGYWMLKNIVTLKLHKGSFKLQGHSKALVQFRIPYQLWPYLWLFQHNTRTWQTHRHLLTSKAALMHCIVRQTGANRLTQVHLSSTRFTWVHLASPGFTQVHLNSPRFTWLHPGSSGFTWVHPASPGFTWRMTIIKVCVQWWCNSNSRSADWFTSNNNLLIKLFDYKDQLSATSCNDRPDATINLHFLTNACITG